MDLQQFDLNLLVSLDALLTEKNVTRAGARMNLSQSAMSGTLARLRDVFHDELLIAVGRGMVLTPLAQDLVQPLHDLLQQVRTTLTTRPRFDAATSDRQDHRRRIIRSTRRNFVGGSSDGGFRWPVGID